MRTRLLAAAALLLLFQPGFSSAQTDQPPAWLYPPVARRNATDPTPRHVPGSTVTYTEAQLRDLNHAIDWRPQDHPPMPEVVANGRPGGVPSCAYCHLTNGQGRTESAPVAGLSPAFFTSQMQAFASKARHSSSSGGAPQPDGRLSNGRFTMNVLAALMTPEDIKAAADYYAAFTFKPWITVVEADVAPPLTYDTGFPIAHFDQPQEPLAGRIVEFGTDQDRAFMRDATVGFTALVPRGSVARGGALVEAGGGAKTPCAKCHGEGLKGGPGATAPPIAGRSPTYIARALYDFGHGSRDDPAAKPMKPSAANLPIGDIVAIAAYVGSLQP